MSDPAADLGRLHDLILPAPVPWWPPAPGWYVLAAGLLALTAWLGWRAWRRWRAEAYRREALRLLARTHDPAAIAALLRRTALAWAGRPQIAALDGEAWADWLAARLGETPDPALRRRLQLAVYAKVVDQTDAQALHAYATRWIAGHRRADAC